MYRLALLALAAATLSPLGAETTIDPVRVYTEPAGLKFYVDGQLYTDSATFSWVSGTQHVVNVAPVQVEFTLGIRSTFRSWSGPIDTVASTDFLTVVTAGPSLPYLKATFDREFRLTLSFFRCTIPNTSLCWYPGTIYVNEDPYQSSSDIWLPGGTAVTLRAVANPGFVFGGWTTTDPSSFTSVTMDRGRYFNVQFKPAARITLATSPPQLQVSVDGVAVVTPLTFEWRQESSHSLSSVSPQVDAAGRLWVFDSWSNGGTESQVYSPPKTVYEKTLTANYVPGATVRFLTDPLGLKLRIDGRDDWPSYDFGWAVGSTHSAMAPLEQVDSRGTTYLFSGWSNGAGASQMVTVSEDALVSGIRLIANYEPRDKLIVESSSPGVNVIVDGTECPTPCSLARPAGARVTISAPQSVLVTEGTRLDFLSWSDGALRERVWTVTTQRNTITARYRISHRLQALADPAGGASFRFDPPSPDGFFEAGTAVSVAAESLAGFRFKRWSGDLSGTANAGVVTLTQPRTVVAVLDLVPSITPGGVVNAAAETPEPGVAPGSIIAIYGASLAPALEAGPSNPLTQTLAGVTVRVGDFLLPLFYVSPTQINAQLPFGLEEGTHYLVVRWEGHPEASTEFSVVRNGPGLFANVVEEVAFAVVLHEDGEIISLESPARRGEVVTLLGTGFGPHKDGSPPAGFPVPISPSFPLSDPVEVLSGDLSIPLKWAGAAAGYSGVTAIRFRIGDQVPGASTLPVRTKVNGRESNTVMLPVE